MVTKNYVTYQNNQWTSHENKAVELNAIQINIYQSKLTKFRRGAIIIIIIIISLFNVDAKNKVKKLQ